MAFFASTKCFSGDTLSAIMHLGWKKLKSNSKPLGDTRLESQLWGRLRRRYTEPKKSNSAWITQHSRAFLISRALINWITRGPKRWSSSSSRGPWFPAPTWWHMVDPNYDSSSRGSDTLLWPPQAPCTHMVHILTCSHNTHTHKIKIIKTLKREKPFLTNNKN